ncbi:protein of unknown function [Burkholderia multivorans]
MLPWCTERSRRHRLDKPSSFSSFLRCGVPTFALQMRGHWAQRRPTRSRATRIRWSAVPTCLPPAAPGRLSPAIPLVRTSTTAVQSVLSVPLKLHRGIPPMHRVYMSKAVVSLQMRG